ncbi:MAG TPA: TIGR03936 family radical SAM-associated protein [Halanaerobiales bacterium]|nr:TIGR03936 family radical SAM-associated protein [Halanaerobiales bacterium]
MYIRAEYEKRDELKYISHLELMNTFRRTFRRANLPVAYSQGYNPHIIFSMSQPLPVGMVGHQEYFDLELKEKISLNKMQKKINQKLPVGLKILDIVQIHEKEKSLQAIVNTARYKYKMSIKKEVDQKKILKDFLDENEIEITRFRRNKDDRLIDLAPMIYSGRVLKDDLWEFTISTGSSGNVRPQEVIRALKIKTNGLVKEIPLVNIERLGMYVREEGKLYKPVNKQVLKKEVKEN